MRRVSLTNADSPRGTLTKPRHFTAYRDKWATLLDAGSSGKQIPLFVSWAHLFPAALQILTWLDDEAEAKDSDYLISSRPAASCNT
jgi:hypothetical protein